MNERADVRRAVRPSERIDAEDEEIDEEQNESEKPDEEQAGGEEPGEVQRVGGGGEEPGRKDNDEGRKLRSNRRPEVAESEGG